MNNKHRKAINVVLGSGVGNHVGGYAAKALVANKRRHFKMRAKADESVDGRLDYKKCNASISGGSMHMNALNQIKARQVFGASFSGKLGGSKAEAQVPKRDYGGNAYDAYGQPLTKVPIAMGGFPHAGYDVDNRGGWGLSYEQFNVDEFNPYYLGTFSAHVAIS